MIFFITTLDHQQSDFHHFHFNHDKLEAAFDILNTIVAQGHVLFKATVIDGSSVIRLPVDAFDGHCCQSAIKALEQEWSALLTGSLNGNNHRNLG